MDNYRKEGIRLGPNFEQKFLIIQAERHRPIERKHRAMSEISRIAITISIEEAILPFLLDGAKPNRARAAR